MNDFDNKLNEFFKTLEDRVTNYIPNMIAETATEHFKNAFISKSWDGVAWQPYKNLKKQPSRGSLMMRSNALFNSIRPSVITPVRVTINAGNSKVPYAKIHNEGGVIAHKARQSVVTHKVYKKGKFAGKTLFAKNNSKATYSQKASISAYNQTMPKRQFMGKSNLLLEEIKTRFKNNFKTI